MLKSPNSKLLSKIPRRVRILILIWFSLLLIAVNLKIYLASISLDPKDRSIKWISEVDHTIIIDDKQKMYYLVIDNTQPDSIRRTVSGSLEWKTNGPWSDPTIFHVSVPQNNRTFIKITPPDFRYSIRVSSHIHSVSKSFVTLYFITGEELQSIEDDKKWELLIEHQNYVIGGPLLIVTFYLINEVKKMKKNNEGNTKLYPNWELD